MASIKTFSGRMFPLVNPAPSDIYIEDIATGLANTCRFSGQLAGGFYSVAQHCVLVSHAVPEGMALQGLLHDAGEAYLGDMTSPLKHELVSRNEHGYRLIENGIMDAVASKFGISARKPPEVAEADLRMFTTEARDLMHGGLADYKIPSMLKPYDIRVVPWGPEAAKKEFLRRFRELVYLRDSPMRELLSELPHSNS